jgi:hypothetical protein
MSGSVIVLIVSARLAWCKTYRLIPLSTYLFSRWSVPLKAPGEAFSPTSLLLHELPWLFPFIGEFWLAWIWIRIPNLDPDSLIQAGSKTQIVAIGRCFGPEDYQAIGEAFSVLMKQLSLKNIAFLSFSFSVGICICFSMSILVLKFFRDQMFAAQCGNWSKVWQQYQTFSQGLIYIFVLVIQIYII